MDTDRSPSKIHRGNLWNIPTFTKIISNKLTIYTYNKIRIMKNCHVSGFFIISKNLMIFYNKIIKGTGNHFQREVKVL